MCTVGRRGKYKIHDPYEDFAAYICHFKQWPCTQIDAKFLIFEDEKQLLHPLAIKSCMPKSHTYSQNVPGYWISRRRGVHISVLKVLHAYLILGSISYQEGLVSNLKSLVVTTWTNPRKIPSTKNGWNRWWPLFILADLLNLDHITYKNPKYTELPIKYYSQVAKS